MSCHRDIIITSIGPFFAWLATIANIGGLLENLNALVTAGAGVSTMILTWTWWIYIRRKIKRIDRELDAE